MKMPEVIYETASFHGGHEKRLFEVIDIIKNQKYAGRRGIKFHAISADKIALPSFHAYPIYEKLQLPIETWRGILAHAAPLDVWLEMADAACADLLLACRNHVRGIKFQPSMIDNVEVLERLAASGPAGLEVLLNVSGLPLDRIEACLTKFLDLGITPESTILQVGFQGYPTAIEDTMLNKLAVIRSAFPDHRLAFADHVSADDPFALVAPCLAVALGCSVVEKHCCLSRAVDPYDTYSALEPSSIAQLNRFLEQTAIAFSDKFVNAAERDYLRNSIQQPCLARGKSAGSLIASEDLHYRRQGTKVLDREAIADEQGRARVLNRDLKEGVGLVQNDFRDARIAVVVACRMKSTRLKLKPLLDIHGKMAIDRCLENCLLFDGMDQVILATSVLDQDDDLVGHTLGGRVKVKRGDPDDVLLRYLEIASSEQLDIIVRVTGDNPVVSPEITAALLESHLRSGADLTRARTEAVGTGPQIINVEAMRRVKATLGSAPMSEYMNWYFENNPDYFKINIIDLPENLVRNYRLTLDYPEDLEMFNRLFAVLDQRNELPYTKNVFAALDSHPEISGINIDQSVVYKTDDSLIQRLREETRFPGR